MANESTIQDYAMIDSFLNNSIQSYRRQVFGDYDSKTGYYNQQRTDDEPVVEQDLSEDADELETDPVNEWGMTEDESMYDVVFDESQYPRQPVDDDGEDFYNFPVDDMNDDGDDTDDGQFVSGAGPGAFSFKAGVSGQGLKSNTQSLINELSSVAGNFVVTSGKRSAKENAGLKGSAVNSFHLTGEAVDIRPNKNVDKFFSSSEGKKYLADRGYEVIDERNVKGVGAHWHVEPVKRQAGGIVPIAHTKEQQFVGLNDDAMESLILPLEGMNTVRGLDSGHPVLVKDETGKIKVLYGPKHTTRMKGRVFERKLIK
jgi:hypothetical protein